MVGTQIFSEGEIQTTTLLNGQQQSNGTTYQSMENGMVANCAMPDKVLTKQTMNPHIWGFRAMEYAARGPIVMKSLELEKELELAKKNGSCNFPFDEVLKMGLGDAHAMGQKPITFIRQVLALVSCPELIEESQFNDDVKRKARDILSSCRGGSVGSYSESRGMVLIRKHVANYIERRDGGIPSNPDDIILTAGASEGIRSCLRLLKSGEAKTSMEQSIKTLTIGSSSTRAGVLIPVPEYPLYSASLAEYNLEKIQYYMDERLSGWEVNVPELTTLVDRARATCDPKAIVIINPGNPTGHVLTRENIEAIIRLAYTERLVILADEVYQDNVYGGKEFVSFKRVLSEMSPPFNSVELISVYSASKGFTCECGLRGGYFEVVNMDPDVKSVLVATAAANLCPTVLGQAVVDCVVDPPKEGDPSFEQFTKEKAEILSSLAERAELVQREFNSMPGITCARLDGAMYAFPQVHIPEKAIQAAVEAGLEPDCFYCARLLENTGICVVPGSGMGQIPGTFHFRTTILAPTEKTKGMLERFRTFQEDFMLEYS